MAILRIALLQLVPSGTDQPANLAIGEAACRQARAMGADLALFPEMWNIGYASYAPAADEMSDLWRAPERWTVGEESAWDALRAARESWQARAVDREGPYVRHFRALARELEMAIALTYLERWPGAPRNTISLIDRHGELALTYAKVHTCAFDPNEAALTPGDGFPVAELDTAAGPVAIGAMICFDREFPESARILMLQGAELVLIPNACDMVPHRLAQVQTRAYENMMGMALANYAAPQHNGHSVAFDPRVYDEHGPRDSLVVEAGEAEGVYLAPFDMEAIRLWRSREVWGNAFRRPRLYATLTALEVAPPFVRVNARGDAFPR